MYPCWSVVVDVNYSSIAWDSVDYVVKFTTVFDVSIFKIDKLVLKF